MNDVGDISKPESSDDTVGEVSCDCFPTISGETPEMLTMTGQTRRILYSFSRLPKRKATGEALVVNDGDVCVTGGDAESVVNKLANEC